MSGVSTHMNEGRARGTPDAPATPLGAPLSYKLHPLLTSHSHLLVRDLSPPLEFIPHGLGLARYMFPMAIRQERVVLPLHRWSEEAEVASTASFRYQDKNVFFLKYAPIMFRRSKTSRDDLVFLDPRPYFGCKTVTHTNTKVLTWRA